MDAFQHQNTFMADFDINFKAYCTYPGRAILIYQVQYFDDYGIPLTEEKFKIYDDEKRATEISYEQSVNEALLHAKSKFTKVTVSKGLKILWVEWGVTIPWERKKYREQLVEAYNNQDVTSQYNDAGINLLPQNFDDDMDFSN